MNIVLDTQASLPVPMPHGLASVFYCALAVLVVHLCQQLIEETANAIDSSSRQVRASRAAIGIGCLTWVLDVVGFFLYPGLAVNDLRLVPALLALLCSMTSARLTVPVLSTSMRAPHVGLAALGLTCGMIVGHILLTMSYLTGPLMLDLRPALFAAAIAVALAVTLAQRHRRTRISALGDTYSPLRWRDKIIAGLVIVPLHWLLVCTFPVHMNPSTGSSDNVRLLLTMLAFGLGIIADQLETVHSERVRQRSFRQAVAPPAQSPSDGEPSQNDQQLALIAARLPELLDSDLLHIFFQPIVTPAKGKAHFEALLRVTDSVLGPINPEHFFLACSLQRETVRADRLIITGALDHLQRWRQLGLSHASINVNVSPDTLLDPNFVPWLSMQQCMRDIGHGALRLEITEHGLIASGETMIQTIHALRRVGVGVVMDDFGSGYSSLGLLADLPISGFKCDRLFIRGLTHDPRRQALLRRIAELAGDLGIPVTAEGVETKEELDIVLDSGIDSVQGYFYARPMPANEIPQWYNSHQETLGIQPV
jgi:EAL domain-containing protein (putative c-di-GMP-specific phosphodiesterase class I)